MKGLMQDWQLTTNKILEHAKRINPTREIVTRRLRERGADKKGNRRESEPVNGFVKSFGDEGPRISRVRTKSEEAMPKRRKV